MYVQLSRALDRCGLSIKETQIPTCPELVIITDGIVTDTDVTQYAFLLTILGKKQRLLHRFSELEKLHEGVEQVLCARPCRCPSVAVCFAADRDERIAGSIPRKAWAVFNFEAV